MTDLEKNWFEKLVSKREKIASALEDDCIAGVKDSVVEKYTEQAHFIYELLQNADDAKATECRFYLQKDKLIFIHNGSKKFTVSNPDTEKEDKEQKKKGDVNSITSIGGSIKSYEKNKIGKFGVGFKAVFQYTETPFIYDDDIAFKIERFIVPKICENNLQERNKGETGFVIPFNSVKRKNEESYEDIKYKLEMLIYPTLYLLHLKNIQYYINNQFGYYEKQEERKEEINDTQVKLIAYKHQNIKGDIKIDNFWQLERIFDEHIYSVVFLYDKKEEKIKPIKKYAFCFFPTKVNTNLNFMIHAPFLLNDSREGILAGKKHNMDLIDKLAKLSADGLEYIKNIGVNEEKKFIDDKITDIIPIKKQLYEVDEKNDISFMPFYEEIKNKFLNCQIIPTDNGYTSSKNAYWAEVTPLCNIFSNKQLSEIVKNDNAKWVFVGKGHQETARNTPELSQYIGELINESIDENDLLEGITKEFIEKQNIDWLHKFYKWISEAQGRTNKVKKISIFIDTTGKAVSAYDNNDKLILFLPSKQIKNCIYVNNELLKNEDTKDFIKKIGVKEPSLKDYIYTVIKKRYDDDGDIDTDEDFSLFFNYFCKCPNEEVDDFINLIKGWAFIRCKNNEGEFCGIGNTMYMPNNELIEYFSEKGDAYFLDYDYYYKITGNIDKLNLFFQKLGVLKDVNVYEEYIEHRADIPYYNSSRPVKYVDKVIDGCKEILKFIEDTKNEKKAILLWETLTKLAKDKTNFEGKAELFYYSPRSRPFESTDLLCLKSSKWLINKNGEFMSSDEIFVEDLLDEFDISSENSKDLISILGIKSKKITDYAEEMNKKMEEEGKNDRYLPPVPVEDFDEAKQILNKFLEKKKEEKKPNTIPLKDLFNDIQSPILNVIENDNIHEIASVINLEKRAASIKKEILDNKNKERFSKIQITKSNEESNKDEYNFLKMEYDGKCQICGERIVDKKGKPYFECTDLFPKSLLEESYMNNNNLAWDALCLCPNCAVRHKLGLISIPNFKDIIEKTKIIEKDNELIVIDIKIGKDNAKLKYTPRHFQNIKIFLETNNDEL